MGTWSSGIGKFTKKGPNHGKWWKKIKHWLCDVGLCNLDKCACNCHCKGRAGAYRQCCKGTPKKED